MEAAITPGHEGFWRKLQGKGGIGAGPGIRWPRISQWHPKQQVERGQEEQGGMGGSGCDVWLSRIRGMSCGK